MLDAPVPAWVRLAARGGSIALVVALPLLLLLGYGASTGVLAALPDPLRSVAAASAVPVLVLFAVAFAAAYLPRPAVDGARPLQCPARGRLMALNGPGTKVPSHGMHGFGQTYAIDLVHEPAPGARPSFGGSRAMRDPREYPSWGRPVHAPADGTVVAVHDARRDHRCRSNWLGYAWMIVESQAFQLRGAAGIMGNRVVLRLDDGTHMALAHLRRGSAQVATGERVVAGDVLAAIGNSGNTSEPHVHLQVMDHRDPNRALGLPFVLTDVVVGDDLDAPDLAPEPLVPEDGVVFHAGVATEPSSSA